MWLAEWLATSARELRISPDRALWHEPLARLRHLQHAFMRARNVWTIRPVETDSVHDQLAVFGFDMSGEA